MITDKTMAIILGWKDLSKKDMGWEPPEDDGIYHKFPPKFTTDLTTIVKEVQARDLMLELTVYGDGINNPKAAIGRDAAIHHVAKTPALAVCHALSAHLKMKKRK